MDNRYVKDMVLGTGGMARVDRCIDTELGRTVAIKRLKPRLSGSRTAQRRFEREIQVQARLQHPSIVPVFEAAQDESGRYLVMQEVSGVTLSDRIKGLEDQGERRRGEQLRLISAFLQVCLAVEYAHQRSVIHRDLKPDNIMLGQFGEVYVLDWGIAKIEGALPTPIQAAHFEDVDLDTRGPFGSPGFASPEQIEAPQAVGPEADVYALGRVLHCILQGEWEARRLKGGASERWGEWRSFDPIVEKATDPTSVRRYRSVRALHDAVEQVLVDHQSVDMRREMARKHLEHAKLASDEGRHLETVRSAARAMSMDPSVNEASEMLTRFLIELPLQDPPELEAERLAMEAAEAKQSLTAYSLVTVAVTAVVLCSLSLMEVLDGGLLALGLLPVTAAAGLLGLLRPRHHWEKGAVLHATGIAAGYALAVFVSGAAFGPWVIPPMIASAVGIVGASNGCFGWRRNYVGAWSLVAMITGFFVWGVDFETGSLIWNERLIVLDPIWTPLLVCSLSVTLLLFTTGAVSLSTDRLRAARHQTHRIQWWLKRISAGGL